MLKSHGSKQSLRNATLCVAVVFIISQLSSQTNAGEISRRTPIVETVQKVRESVVAIKNKNGKFAGAGVIIDVRGYFITNRHVVGSASTVRVRLHDGQELTADLCAADTDCDLAILRVQTDCTLTALPLGNTRDLMVGESVIAVGHPYGYLNTVSTGIVSAFNRTLTMPSGEEMSGLIQTDASINPGNSGGPLLNINGELIGINFAVRSEANGIAFAINIETVKQVFRDHIGVMQVAAPTQEMHVARKVAPDVTETSDPQVEEKSDPEVKKGASVHCEKRTDAHLAQELAAATTEVSAPTRPGPQPTADLLAQLFSRILECDWNCGAGTLVVLLLAMRVGFSMGKQRVGPAVSPKSLQS